MAGKPRPIIFEIGEDGCFVVTSHALDIGGYPKIWKYNHPYPMHRHIYEECFGYIDDGLIVRHKCDNRRCINPEHLELGTPADNSRDMVKRGRSAKGEKCPRSKLTGEIVINIRADTTHSQEELASIYGISRSAITRIKNYTTWKHI